MSETDKLKKRIQNQAESANETLADNHKRVEQHVKEPIERRAKELADIQQQKIADERKKKELWKTYPFEEPEGGE